MCGIVGYFGKKEDVLDVLLTGLKRLEYRGYDSAGICVKTSDGYYSQKAVGKVKNLEEEIYNNPPENLEEIGIAHTRWATHGVPSKVNSHPHSGANNKIWLVHNGIIENYKELKSFLEKNGIVFRSQTDTEVVAQLIEYYYQNNLQETINAVLPMLKGAFSLAIFSTQENLLIGAKKGSPLLLGVAKDSLILASDASAIIQKTKQVIYLEDDEMIVINSNSDYKIFNFDQKIHSKKIQTLEWDDDSATKNGYPHFLLKEIMEQPQTIQDSIRGRLILEEGSVKFGGLENIQEKLKNINKIILIGVGTSAYSAKIGEMYFEELAKIPAKVEISPEFRYKDVFVDEKTWVIALSQSGETADTISAIKEAKNKGALVTGIVNSVGSTISRITEAGVYNHIGPEISVASTKAFTSQTVLLLMHALMLARITGKISLSESKKIIQEILGLEKEIQKVLQKSSEIQKISQKYSKYQNLFYIGRKYNHPVALEGALKIKEIAYIHAEGLAGGELKHGFIALVDENMPTIAIASQDSVYEKQVSNIEEIKARKGLVLAIATENDNKISQIADDVIYLPKVSEILSPIINSIALQLLAYHTSVTKGLDVDQPRNLAKSVTVE